MPKPVLGRGLSALLGGVASSPKTSPFSSAPAAATATAVAIPPVEEPERVRRIAIQRIHPCPFQPRKDFSDESLRELADSIKEKGGVQPLIERQKGNDYELIAGERQWRAEQLVGLADVRVLVRQADDRSVLEVAVVDEL